jgi:tetratricopeptide (TPR) repeat protein
MLAPVNRSTAPSYEAGRRAEAIPYFDRAIAADPKQKEAWLYRGRSFGETKNDGEAFHSYEQALRLDPCYAEAFFQRGRTYLWERSPERAIREFNSAIRCDPKVSKYYLHRASVHHQSRKPSSNGPADSACEQETRIRRTTHPLLDSVELQVLPCQSGGFISAFSYHPGFVRRQG